MAWSSKPSWAMKPGGPVWNRFCTGLKSCAWRSCHACVFDAQRWECERCSHEVTRWGSTGAWEVVGAWKRHAGRNGDTWRRYWNFWTCVKACGALNGEDRGWLGNVNKRFAWRRDHRSVWLIVVARGWTTDSSGGTWKRVWRPSVAKLPQITRSVP